MRRTQGRPNTTLRTMTPSAKHIQRPQPITREEMLEVSQRLTPEECRNIVAKALLSGWATMPSRINSQCGDSEGGNA